MGITISEGSDGVTPMTNGPAFRTGSIWCERNVNPDPEITRLLL